MLQELGLEDRFVLAGFTDSLDRYMPHFDLFVQSSHTEGLPNVLLEALAAGVPVVATDVGGTREVLNGGAHGQLVAPGRSMEMSSLLHRALTTTPGSSVSIEKARAWVETGFSFKRQAMDYRLLLSDPQANSNSNPLKRNSAWSHA